MFHVLSKCSMLNPTVGTEIDFRSSLFLKKFTIVDLPELFKPMSRMLICFGFLSLFKIFINNFSNTIFTFHNYNFSLELQTGFAGMFILSSAENFSDFLCFVMKILNTKSRYQVFNMTHCVVALHTD